MRHLPILPCFRKAIASPYGSLNARAGFLLRGIVPCAPSSCD